MKTVRIIGNKDFTDADFIMNQLEYLFGVNALPESFEVISANTAGAEAVITPLLKEAGITVIETVEPSEVDILVVFYLDESDPVYQPMMEQWRNHKPVYPFKVHL